MKDTCPRWCSQWSWSCPQWTAGRSFGPSSPQTCFSSSHNKQFWSYPETLCLMDRFWELSLDDKKYESISCYNLGMNCQNEGTMVVEKAVSSLVTSLEVRLVRLRIGIFRLVHLRIGIVRLVCLRIGIFLIENVRLQLIPCIRKPYIQAKNFLLNINLFLWQPKFHLTILSTNSLAFFSASPAPCPILNPGFIWIWYLWRQTFYDCIHKFNIVW